MESKDKPENSSDGADDEFVNCPSCGITPPPPQSDMTPPPLDSSLVAIPEQRLDPYSAIASPSNRNLTFVEIDDVNSRRIIHGECHRGAHEKHSEADEDDAAPLPPEVIAASFEEQENDEEEEWEEAEDNDAPIPPEMMASTYEVSEDAKNKLVLIVNDDGGFVSNDEVSDVDAAPLPPEVIAASFEEQENDEKEKWEEAEDTDAPSPPEMMAATYEVSEDAKNKLEMIDDDYGGFVSNDEVSDVDAAPLPPEFIAASFEEQENDEEEKWEEAEDTDAPSPPEMIAATYEIYDNAALDAKKALEANRENNVFVPEVQTEPQDNINGAQDEIPESGTLLPSTDTDYSIMSNNEATSGVGFFSNNHSNHQSDELMSFIGDQNHVQLTVNPPPELMLNIDPSYQSLPLLEGALVQDLPEVPIYDAFPINPTQDNNSGGWFMRARKYRVIILAWVLMAMTGIIAVAVMATSRNGNEPTKSDIPSDPIMTSTTSTIALSELLAVPSTWKPQGDAVIGDAENDHLGKSIALSADSKTLVVGAPGDFGGTEKKGYVKVYHTASDASNKTKLSQTIYGAVGDLFGMSVDISADGKILAIGSPGNFMNADRAGFVQVYTLQSSGDFDSTWKLLGKNITGEKKGDEFGKSISLSGDGKTLAVGAWQNDGNGKDSGCVRIYHFEDNCRSWVQVGNDIYGESAEESVGTSVSLSRNGTTLAIGSIWSGDKGINSGHVKVYRINCEGSSCNSEGLRWEPLGQTLFGVTSYDFFGWFVQVSANGKTLAIGSPGYIQTNRPGFVRVYILEGSDNNNFNWKQHGQEITSKQAEVKVGLGRSGSLSGDGKTLCIGVNQDTDSGVQGSYVRVYRMDDSYSGWTQIGEDIDGKDAEDSLSLSLSEDGKVVAIGSYANDEKGADSGQVRVLAVME